MEHKSLHNISYQSYDMILIVPVNVRARTCFLDPPGPPFGAGDEDVCILLVG